MKKIAIFFVLALMLSAFVFAVDGIGDFAVRVTVEINNANSKDEQQAVVITPAFTFSRNLIENFNFFIGLDSDEVVLGGDQNFRIPFNSDNEASVQFKKLDEKISYRLAAVPGNMNVYIRNRNHFFIKPSGQDTVGGLRAGVNYASPAGPGTISGDLYTGFSYAPEFNYDDFGFALNYSFNFGLGVYTDTCFNLGKNVDFGYMLTYWQLAYSIPNTKITTGVEGGFLYLSDLEKLWIPIKPFIQYSGLTDGLTLGVYVKFFALNNDSDMVVSPGIYATYSF
jgi:hypothetical protein